MPWFGSDADKSLALCMERWQQAALDQLDDIRTFRDSQEPRVWETPYPMFDADAGWLAAKAMDLTNGRPEPIWDIRKWVAAWHRDRSAASIPPHADVDDTERRMLDVLTAIYSGIQSRREDVDPRWTEYHPKADWIKANPAAFSSGGKWQRFMEANRDASGLRPGSWDYRFLRELVERERLVEPEK